MRISLQLVVCLVCLVPPRLEQGTISPSTARRKGSSQKDAWVACQCDSVSGGLSFGHQGWRETARPSCAILQRLALIDMTWNLTKSYYNLIGRKTWEQVKKWDAINLLEFSQNLKLSSPFAALSCLWHCIWRPWLQDHQRCGKLGVSGSGRSSTIQNHIASTDGYSQLRMLLKLWHFCDFINAPELEFGSRDESLELKWSIRYKWMQLDLHRYPKFSERSQKK